MTRTIALLSVAAFVALAGTAEAGTMKIFNATQHAFVAVRIKKPHATEWAREVLGNKVLGIGKVAAIDLGPASECRYDMQAALDDGSKIEKLDVDVCKTTLISFAAPK